MDIRGIKGGLGDRRRNSALSNHLYSPTSVVPYRVKADHNTANGGIGVTYSNVVLAGGINPRVEGPTYIPKSSY